MREIAHYLLDPDARFDDAQSLLSAQPGVTSDIDITGERCYLDTPDHGLLHRELVLECDRDADTTILNLRSANELSLSATWQNDMPHTAVDVASTDARHAIYEAIGTAHFDVIARRPLRARHYAYRPGSGKAVAHVIIQQLAAHDHDDARIEVRVFSGSRRRTRAEEFARTLRNSLPIDYAPDADALGSLDLASAELPEGLMSSAPSLSREDSIGIAVIKVLAANFHILVTRETGIAADLDTEFLHDFRIALRRMRSLFEAFRPMFDKRVAGLLKADLKWLNQATGARRDLDVFLNHFHVLRHRATGADDEALRTLRAYVVSERERAQETLNRDLGSKRYEVFKTDWSTLLRQPALDGEAGSHNVVEAAGASIWKTYRRIRRLSRDPQVTNNIDALHTLRKECKKLRYQIESFRSVFPRKRLDKAVAELKHLQDMLGAVCDLSVQQRFLTRRRKQMVAEQTDPKPLERFVDALLARYGKDEARLRRNLHGDLERFSSRKVARRYRELFSPGT